MTLGAAEDNIGLRKTILASIFTGPGGKELAAPRHALSREDTAFQSFAAALDGITFRLPADAIVGLGALMPSSQPVSAHRVRGPLSALASASLALASPVSWPPISGVSGWLAASWSRSPAAVAARRDHPARSRPIGATIAFFGPLRFPGPRFADCAKDGIRHH